MRSTNSAMTPDPTRGLTLHAFALRLLLVLALAIPAVSLTGCFGYDDADYIQAILDWLEANAAEESTDEVVEEMEGVELALTYPAGASEKVFVTGWPYGARCIVQTEDGPVDMSDKVKWRGSGTFSPATGSRTRSSFDGVGSNEIVLSVEVDGKTLERTFPVQAVSTILYAAVGDQARCEADAHGVFTDPLSVIGPITTGSPIVYINGRPAARVGDVGVHAACTGPNTFTITGHGGSEVKINGRYAAKKGAETQHCGGIGEIVTGSGS